MEPLIHNSVEDRHDDFGGLTRDIPHLFNRRRALVMLGGASLATVLAACGNSTSSDTTQIADSNSTTSSSSPSSGNSGASIPDETQGPFPADGTNGPNVLSESGVVKKDITTSFGSLSGTAQGIPLNISLTVVDARTGATLPNSAIYIWHCTADGKYSIYEDSSQNYLRGIQTTDAAGVVTFNSIFPGCYSGRWPHCHFEIYSSLTAATNGSQATKTSQLALPEASCREAYADPRYGNSASNIDRLSLTSDNVFRDGWSDQLATMTGDASSGYTATLLVRV